MLPTPLGSLIDNNNVKFFCESGHQDCEFVLLQRSESRHQKCEWQHPGWHFRNVQLCQVQAQRVPTAGCTSGNTMFPKLLEFVENLLINANFSISLSPGLYIYLYLK